MKLIQFERALSRFNRADGNKRFGYRITHDKEGNVFSLRLVVHDDPLDFSKETILPVNVRGKAAGDFEPELDKGTNPIARILTERAKTELVN